MYIKNNSHIKLIVIGLGISISSSPGKTSFLLLLFSLNYMCISWFCVLIRYVTLLLLSDSYVEKSDFLLEHD